MTNNTCIVEGCNLPVKIKKHGLCSPHYQRQIKYGTPTGGPLATRASMPKTCTVEGCDTRVLARGLCSPHYQRNRAYGDPLGTSNRVYEPQYKGEGPAFVADAVANRDRSKCWTDGGFSVRKGASGDYPLISGLAVGHLAMELDGRPRPDGMFQLHQCDNPPCWNPGHLRWGTPAENAAEREERGRGVRNRGEKHGNAKLTEAVAQQILDRYNATKHLPQRHPDRPSLRALATEFGVTEGSVHPLVNRRTWTHLK